MTPAASLPLLSIELVLFWLAVIFSTICTVIVSPTRRARWSSNSGRYCVGLEDRAVARRTGAADRRRQRRSASAMSTGGRGFSVLAAAQRGEHGRGDHGAGDGAGERFIVCGSHSWASFCSIWSEVWIAFELSS